jgi:hypothetical protein
MRARRRLAGDGVVPSGATHRAVSRQANRPSWFKATSFTHVRRGFSAGAEANGYMITGGSTARVLMSRTE